MTQGGTHRKSLKAFFSAQREKVIHLYHRGKQKGVVTRSNSLQQRLLALGVCKITLLRRTIIVHTHLVTGPCVTGQLRKQLGTQVLSTWLRFIFRLCVSLAHSTKILMGTPLKKADLYSCELLRFLLWCIGTTIALVRRCQWVCLMIRTLSVFEDRTFCDSRQRSTSDEMCVFQCFFSGISVFERATLLKDWTRLQLLSHGRDCRILGIQFFHPWRSAKEFGRAYLQSCPPKQTVFQAALSAIQPWLPLLSQQMQEHRSIPLSPSFRVITWWSREVAGRNSRKARESQGDKKLCTERLQGRDRKQRVLKKFKLGGQAREIETSSNW